MPSSVAPLNNLSRKLMRSFATLLLVLLGLLAFALWNFHRLGRADGWKAHTYQVLLESQKIKENLFLMDNGIRTYVVSGRKSDLDTYREGERGFRDHLFELQRLVEDNPPQEDRLTQVIALTKTWQNTQLLPTAAARLPSDTLVQALVKSSRTTLAKRRGLDGIRAQLDGFDGVERGLLATRISEQERSRSLAESTLWLGSGFSILLVMFLSSTAVRAVNESRAAYVHLRTANAELQNVRAGLEQEIEGRRAAQERLKRAVGDLKRSNAELEQFAYVASHDLQEPLRAIAGCVQVLKRRYEGKLDERADQFIGHAVEGAQRMQNLIQDLLAYSRVGTKGKPFAPVALESVVDNALRNLSVVVDESKAHIEREAMPQLWGDAGQLESVFQNLLSNALKFRGEQAPEVRVGCVPTPGANGETGWTFSVSDQGPGIEAQYFERIFVMFQRLHTRTEYAGTGIGLAIVKKIIERHGGRIWVESEVGQGTTFSFWLPEQPPVQSQSEAELELDGDGEAEREDNSESEVGERELETVGAPRERELTN